MKNKIDFLIVIDWLITPMMEIGSEIAIEKALEKKEINILIVDDYIKSEGFNTRLPKLFSKYDIPKKLEEIILSKKYDNIKIYTKKIYKNIELEFWPKEISNALLKIQEHQFDYINKYLRSIILNNINVGEGILSSIISITKKIYPTYINDKKTIEEVFNLFVRRYYMYCTFFKKDLKIENLVIFNGRFASSKAIESGISKHNQKTKLFYYERSHNLYRYTLKPYKVHDRKKIINEINKHWIYCNEQNEASKIAETYFKIKISGRGFDWFPFSKGIQENEDDLIAVKLKNFKNEGKNKIISYFSSSEDEFESLGDIWSDKRFNLKQEQIIEELSRISVKKNIKLIIRLHPNLNNASIESKMQWNNILSRLPKNNILIIKQNSKISSYKVINYSDIVIVFGSTVGVEALYLKKPVILTGPSFYLGTKGKINAVFKIKDLEKNIDDLINKNFLNNDGSKKLLKESSYPYGYWAYTHGLKYQNFAPLTPVRGYLLKYDLQKLHRILSKLKKILKLFFRF